ncbi:sensor histidine kinase [Spirosoma foliorum]|uniref:Histidine kinase n=1 Tax=Spirosoma foliorum TaxID=2710596 RepID=A0A7G5H0N0_9BACT|nr:histidine kinase [Spirosoma foliorum]QMW04672.1 histidine kinase [Spirosoma foliorum]
MHVPNWIGERKSWVRESLFFTVLFVLMSLNAWNRLTTWDDFWRALVNFLILYSQAQFHRFFLFPLLFSQHIKRYVILTSVALFVGSLIVYWADFWLCPEFFASHDWREMGLFHLATCTVSLIAIMALFLIRRFYEQQEKQNADQLLLQEVQMKFLHAQLNPHFFFNTLNNLYGISLHQPTRMPNLIMQLSKLMRYQVDSSRRSWVLLQQEVEFITSYVTLEQERVGNRCQIEYSYPTDPCVLQGYQLAPLLLIPLVENAFKHGTSDIQGCFVYISLTLDGDALTLRIENSMPGHKVPVSSTGLGLQNTRQRLEILYSGKHQLRVDQSAGLYKTELVVQLTPLHHAQPIAVPAY